ncbi:MAG TPA: hypothetical protein VK064_02520, partial [Wenzhouxiangella sp.]|nr:hypothetical protein [Wenzhouxiangella sp.]
MKKIISFVAGASMLLAGSLAAQTPQTSSGVPDESFLAEQFCFETQFSNSGAVGYGPYLRIELVDGLTLDSVEIFGTGGTLIDAGEFPPAPDNQLDDPVIGEAVTGEPGSRLYIIKYPVGSVVDGGPDLPATLCVTIDEEAVVGEPLDVNITPVYEFGDTPTGDNGPIVGSTEQNDVTPTVILFEKTENAPESERTPGPSWPYSYTLTVDIANTATVNPLVIADELPADFQYDGNGVNISGGNGCSVTLEPSTSTPGGQLEVTCTGNTVGTTASDDVVVTYSGHLIDLLDEAICHDEPVVNQAWVQGTYQPGSGPEIVLPLHEDEAVVTARHVAVQKHVSPAQAIPGQGLTYTLD